MKCLECGGEVHVGHEDWPHPDLPEVTLRGVEVRRCARDPQHYEVDLPRLGPLHRTIAARLVEKPARLAGAEIRFLREGGEWTAVELARMLDVSPSSLSRWENDKEQPSGSLDRLVRMIAAAKLGLPAPLTTAARILPSATPMRLALHFGPEGWQAIEEKDPLHDWLSIPAKVRAEFLRILEETLASRVDPKVEASAVALLRSFMPAEPEDAPEKLAG